MQDEERGFPLALLHCWPFLQLFLLSASLAATNIADRTFSLLVTAPTARVCVTKQAGTNHTGLFKPGWSASNCAIGPRDQSWESAYTVQSNLPVRIRKVG